MWGMSSLFVTIVGFELCMVFNKVSPGWGGLTSEPLESNKVESSPRWIICICITNAQQLPGQMAMIAHLSMQACIDDCQLLQEMQKAGHAVADA